MAKLGIYIEIKEGTPKKSNLETLSLARNSSFDTVAVIFCNDLTPYQDLLKGINQVVQIKGDDLTYQPDVYASNLAQVIKDQSISHFLGIFSAQGKDLFPRVAAKLDASLINDCVEIDFNSGKVLKPVYAGKLLSEYQLSDQINMFTIRPNVFAVSPADGDFPADTVTVDLAGNGAKTLIKEVIQSESRKIDLTEAEIIVSGGRGMKAKENFSLLEELAAVLNAGVGASRAAVDSEYATSDMQVGQTGKVVNPKLYIACGISGAIQHFVGMKTSKVIVAINKDPEAPIFKKADYGIVGDLFEVVPLLKTELEKVI